MAEASRIAAEIKPFVIKWIEQAQLGGAGSTSGGSGGGIVSGAPTPHALSSSHHTGLLGDDQAPQFVLLDGSRPLEGDWAVNPGVTIDGVDISAHAANVNAHHLRDHVLATNAGLGATHTISGATAGQVLRASGDTAANFQALAHTDLTSVLPDQHHARDHAITGATHTHSGGAALDVVGLSGPSVIAMLTPKSDVANPSPSAAILRSTSDGKLTLGILDVSGEATVGETFESGGNNFRVIYHADPDGAGPGVSHVHVIVNPDYGWTAIDEQFGMEIVDNLRVWGYIVGNLALQIKDMEPVIAFDGAIPYESNYTGSAIASGGQNWVNVPASKNPIFRPGRFGKGVEVHRAGTNLWTNPSFEIDSTGTSNHNGATHAVTTATRWYGAQSLRVETGTDPHAGVILNGPTHSTGPGTDYSAIIWIRRTEVESDLILSLRQNSTDEINRTVIPQRLGWQPVTVADSPTANGDIRLYIQKANDAANVVFYLDGIGIYQSAHALPVALGDMSTNEGNDSHAWTGAANASSTVFTKTGGYYPSTSAIYTPGGYGSVGIWARLPWLAGSGGGGASHYLFTAGDSNLSIRFNISGNIIFRAGGSAESAYTPTTLDGDWHLYFVTWNDDTNLVSLWIDGVVVATTAYVGPVTLANMYIGTGAGASGEADGTLDHYMAASRELEPEEMLAIYEADGPAFAYRSAFNLRFGRNRFYMDDEGFWGTGASGRRLIGIYAGVDGNPAATKSWGGTNLTEGDILFGQKGTWGGGWMHFDQNAVEGQPRWAWGYSDGFNDIEVLQVDVHGATLNGVLDISTTGELRQGSGTWPGSFTGTRIWSDGGIGRVGGYNAGALQWYGDTDGTLKAGGGDVELNSSGVEIIRQASLVTADSYKFVNSSGVAKSGLGGWFDSGSDTNYLELWANDAGRNNTVYLHSTSTLAAKAAETLLYARNTGTGFSATLRLSSVNSPGRVFDALADYMYLDASQFVRIGGIGTSETGVLQVPTIRAIAGGGVAIRDDGNNLGVFVQDGGQVAIGRSSASHALHVNGQLAVESAAARKFVAKALDSGLFTHFGTESNHSFSMITNNAERVRILATGQVGINTYPPTAQFDVTSGDNARVAAIVNSGASPTIDIMRVLRAGVEKFTVNEDGIPKVVNNYVDPVTSANLGALLYLQSTIAGGANRVIAKISAFGKTTGTVQDVLSVEQYFQQINASYSAYRTAWFVVTQDGDQAGEADKYPLAVIGSNVGLVGATLEVDYMGGGKGVISIKNAETIPTSNTTSGGILYASGGTLYWRSSAGNVRTVAAV